MDTTEKIARQDQIAMLGICSGGMISSMVLARRAAKGNLDRVAGSASRISVLDQEQAGLPSTLSLAQGCGGIDPGVGGEGLPRRAGVLRRGLRMAAAQRPDLDCWVNNYLLGYPAKAFDILYSNTDPVPITTAMHRDFMDLAMSNRLTPTEAPHMLGTDIDLGKINTPDRLVSRRHGHDHLCEWESCYQTTQLFGGDTKFVLSTAATSPRW